MKNIKKFQDFINEKMDNVSKKDISEKYKELKRKGLKEINKQHKENGKEGSIGMSDVHDDNIIDILKGDEKTEFKRLSKEMDKLMGFKVKENVDTTDLNLNHIASEIERGITSGEQPIQWELEVRVRDWVKLDDEDIDMIASLIRNGNLEGNDPIDWNLEFGGDSFDIVEEEESIDDDDDDDDDDANPFYVRIEQGDKLAIVKLEMNNRNKWVETLVSGDDIYGIGQTYMGYLSCDDILSYLHKDYDSAEIISKEEAYENDGIEEEEELTRKDIANQLDIDESDFEDSHDLGNMADKLINQDNDLEFVQYDVDELFDAYIEHNDISSYSTGIIDPSLKYDKEAKLFNDIINYYDEFEADYGYLDSIGTEEFKLLLKDKIRNFFKEKNISEKLNTEELTKSVLIKNIPSECKDIEIWKNAVNACLITGKKTDSIKNVKSQYKYLLKAKLHIVGKYKTKNKK